MLIVNFRKCDKVIDTNVYPYVEEEFDSANWENISTVGFYFRGVLGDYCMFFVRDECLVLMYNNQLYPITSESNIRCSKIKGKLWQLDYINNELQFTFTYESYVYDPYDDDSEEDVNFGLWVRYVLNNSEVLKRFIKSNSL